MNNLHENEVGIENAVRELNDLISHLNELISSLREVLSEVREMTSGTEAIKPAIFLMPNSSVEMPRQASVRKEKTN
jgi:hypothetical protein